MFFKAHAHLFIQTNMYPHKWVVTIAQTVFQGSEAKRELKCFHGSGVSSLLFQVEVALAMLCKMQLISKSTDNYLVNRQTFSPCQHEIVTSRVTRAVKWRNNICCLWREGSGKRRGEDKSENKFCPFLKSHRNSEHSLVSNEAKIPVLKLSGKKMFPISLYFKISLQNCFIPVPSKNCANTEPGDRHEPGL